MTNLYGFRPTYFFKKVSKAPRCGEVDCKEMAQVGWGICRQHLNRSKSVKQSYAERQYERAESIRDGLKEDGVVV